MSRSRKTLITLTLVLITVNVMGQDQGMSWLEFEDSRQSINSFGMVLLVLWASLNILSGIFGWIFGKGPTRYFFQMNAFWNLVNLGLGLAGLFSAATDLSTLTQGQIISAYHDMQNLYILNAGLDVAYIAIAFLLLERAKYILKWRFLLRGYGFSLIVQGSFLFVFDLIMFFIHKNYAELYLYPLWN